MKKWFVCGSVLLALALSLPAQKPKSKKEAEAVRAMLAAPDPDGRIAAAENVLNQFADSEYKAISLMVLAQSYQDKGDTLKSMVYAEQALDANPKDYNSMLMLANSATSLVGDLNSTKSKSLSKKECMACPPSCTMVTKSRCKPTEFIKINGTSVSYNGY